MGEKYEIKNNAEIKHNIMNEITSAEKNKLKKFNNTTREYEITVKIHELFEEQAKKNPNSTALVFNEKKISYKELYEKVNKLAAKIKFDENNKIVGIVMDRSPEMITSMLAILKAGGAFLPIDIENPDERINFMLEDSKVSLILVNSNLNKRIRFNGNIIYLSFNDIQFQELEVIDLNYSPNTSGLAYIIYTSGSTGKPKGIMIEHKSLLNFIYGISEKIDFSEGKTILSQTSISFDIFLVENLLPLTKGLTVVLATEAQRRNPRSLARLIEENEIDMIQMTPSGIKLILNDKFLSNTFKNLKEIMIGGEIFTIDVYNKLKPLTDGKIYNMYGPAETTIWSTIYEVNDNEQEMYIGQPIANTEVLILDEDDNVLPIGFEGELAISGDGLARGYINQQKLTEQKFIKHHYYCDKKIYKTGDIAKWSDDGKLVFVGRRDYQVKIRGHRIELGEIENILRTYHMVEDVIVYPKDSQNGEKFLCASIVSNSEIEENELYNFLKDKLPKYMIPQQINFINSIPLNINGKVDYQSLIKLHDIENNTNDLSRNTDIRLRSILKKGFKFEKTVDSLSLDDSLNLDSINYVRFLVKIENEFSFRFPDEDINYNKFPNLKSIINYLEEKVV